MQHSISYPTQMRWATMAVLIGFPQCMARRYIQFDKGVCYSTTNKHNNNRWLVWSFFSRTVITSSSSSTNMLTIFTRSLAPRPSWMAANFKGIIKERNRVMTELKSSLESFWEKLVDSLLYSRSQSILRVGHVFCLNDVLGGIFGTELNIHKMYCGGGKKKMNGSAGKMWHTKRRHLEGGRKKKKF